MNRSGLRKLILGSAIAALSLWYGLRQHLTGAGPSVAEATTAEVMNIDEILGALSPVAVTAEMQAELRERRLLAEAAWPADPFFKFTAPDQQQVQQEQAVDGAMGPRFLLKAIMSGERPLAMINGTVCAVGDRLADGSTIIAIDDCTVTLKGPQGPWLLRLSE